MAAAAIAFAIALSLALMSCSGTGRGEDGPESMPAPEPWRVGRLVFRFRTMSGLASENGVTRRDPSSPLIVDGTYYVWYGKSERTRSGLDGSIAYATSTNGLHWRERGLALEPGAPGSFDDQGVLAPQVIAAAGRYFLFYTGVGRPFDQRSPTAIGVAVADRPDGPWRRAAAGPVFEPLGRGTGAARADAWDDHRVSVSAVLERDGRYWLYYEGRRLGAGNTDVATGLAAASRPEGPYHRVSANPVIADAAGRMFWPVHGGVAAVVTGVGPRRSSLRFAPDGQAFETMAALFGAPLAGSAALPARGEARPDPLGIAWGVSMVHHPRWPYLVRFDVTVEAPPRP